jgi:hypothetical protein
VVNKKDFVRCSLEVEFPFILPRGYVDAAGQVQREGSMRLATAIDEIESIHDPRVLSNEAYLPVALLSRVITRLGSLPSITPAMVEHFYAADLAYLEDLYLRLNLHEQVMVGAVCPHCGTSFQMQVAPLEANDVG